MEEQKIKIGHNTIRQNQTEMHLRSALDVLNGEFKTALEAIGFTLTDENLSDCYTGGYKTYDKYYQKIQNDASQINTPAIKKTLEDSAQQGWKEFNLKREKALSRIQTDIRKYISVKNGEAVVTKEAKEQLFEDCGIFLINQEEIERYRLHQKVCEALNAFFEGHYSAFWYQLFLWEGGKFSPELADYEYINKKINQLKTK
ncbi:MAG TPA: hypothetical protein VHO50_07140 [Bacteroidales bacterium]|nr:hypothetical protein [Bacteroidales bacterium]